MKVQVKIVKTLIGWYNVKASDTDELLLNIPFKTIERLIPGFSENTSLATAELLMSAIMEVQHG